MERVLLLIGAAAGFSAVVAGTFAAHALDPQLPPKMHTVFETGVRYHMYHALAIVACALMCRDRHWSGRLPLWAGACFLMGICLFSGSLYLLALTGARWLGMVAPVGGTAFLLGWACLLVLAAKRCSASVSRA